ncbi:MAG TPA: hypothetical protein VGV35_00335 [Bryobacteraceae bacterium]|nr:hypothetical protein [Bryobacteraceae bacterium]
MYPAQAEELLPDDECHTVLDVGWAGKKNGALLPLAETDCFDLFITMDKGVQYQQNLAGRNIAILILRTRSNRLTDLLPHLEACRLVMSSIKPGEVIRVGE